MTRSLSDIASAAGLPNEDAAERLLLELVAEKQISVQISGQKRMVTFVEGNEADENVGTTAQLDAMIQDVRDLGERMQTVKDKIELDPEYRNKVLQTEQHSKLDG